MKTYYITLKAQNPILFEVVVDAPSKAEAEKKAISQARRECHYHYSCYNGEESMWEVDSAYEIKFGDK